MLKKTTFDYLGSDGSGQRQSRETYDRGNADGMMVEACATCRSLPARRTGLDVTAVGTATGW